ncbi:M23 family metallopeptidase [Nocardia sp. NPDC001965]
MQKHLLLVRQIGWIIIMIIAVLRCLSAESGGDWAAGFLTLVFMLLATRFFLVPGTNIAPFPVLHLESLSIFISIPAFFGVPDRTAELMQFPLWSWGALVVAVVSARFISSTLTVDTPVENELVFPLEQGRWLIGEGDNRLFNHHWPAKSQRAALDIIGISTLWSSRKRFREGADSGRIIFGAPVYAPCSGRVEQAWDDTPDGDANWPRSGGNEIAIDNGSEVVFLSHLRHGSVQVVVGQFVEAGERVGAVGNSGNSSEPHLHIHAESDGEPRYLVFQGMRMRFHKGAVVDTPGKERQPAT